MPFYAVRVGRNPGVYHTWNECKAEVDSFPKARYKKFDSEADAEAFVAGTDQPGKKGKEKVDLAEKEIALAKEKLEILEKQKALAVKEQELEDMKKASSKGPAHKGAGPSKGVASHSDKPYSRPFSTSAAKDAKKSKESKKTKLLDIEEVKKLAKETAPAEDSSLGVVVYTDGACCFNGMHGAQGGIGVYWGPDSPWNVSERLKAEGKPTNNRAEIHAVVKAIEQAKERGIKELNVHTDSQFLINSMTKWIHGWKKKGWKLSTGGDVVNKEDFLVLEEASKGIKVNYTHVKGHEGVPGNEAADKLAVAGTKKKPGE